MKIAVEGCAHGDLDNIYSSIKEVEEKENFKIDLLICCGDFQSSRNNEDLACMAVPPKYRSICSFYKYFSGEKKAPVLTIFIGGNHEASNYLQELPYGGWVAPNIYYLGYAGVINIAGVRIGGISGIYKGRDFLKGRFERPPYDENTKRSVYHIRNLDVFRIKQLSEPMDIFLSHDWPTGIYHYGNVQKLLERKPFFRGEIEANQLGSKPCEEILHHLQPKFWFSAHLHCKFVALVPHDNDKPPTKFLALDKCLPRRQFLQLVDIPHDQERKIEIEYDLEWLTVLFLTNHLLNVKNINTYMPGPGGNERYNFTPTEEEKTVVLNKMCNNLKIPENFRPTASAYQPGTTLKTTFQPEAKLNPQTVELCDLLCIDDPISLISEKQGLNISLDSSFYENSTFIRDSDDSSDVPSDIEPISEQQAAVAPMKLPDPKLELSALCDEEVEKRKNNLSKDGLKNCSVKDEDDLDVKCGETDDDSVEAESGLLSNEIEERLAMTSDPLDECLSKRSPKRSIPNEETDGKSLSGLSEGQNNNTPTIKKFKRRNASIYINEENS